MKSCNISKGGAVLVTRWSMGRHNLVEGNKMLKNKGRRQVLRHRFKQSKLYIYILLA